MQLGTLSLSEATSGLGGAADDDDPPAPPTPDPAAKVAAGPCHAHPDR